MQFSAKMRPIFELWTDKTDKAWFTAVPDMEP